MLLDSCEAISPGKNVSKVSKRGKGDCNGADWKESGHPFWSRSGSRHGQFQYPNRARSRSGLVASVLQSGSTRRWVWLFSTLGNGKSDDGCAIAPDIPMPKGRGFTGVPMNLPELRVEPPSFRAGMESAALEERLLFGYTLLGRPVRDHATDLHGEGFNPFTTPTGSPCGAGGGPNGRNGLGIREGGCGERRTEPSPMGASIADSEVSQESLSPAFARAGSSRRGGY
jgi:hypothetical protein